MKTQPMIKFVSWIALAAMTCGACTTPTTTANQQGVQVPVRASWRVRTSPAVGATPGVALLTARIEQNAVLPAALTVSVQLPPGATLARGPRTFAIPAKGIGSVTEMDYEVRFAGVPSSDLLLVVDSQTPGFGVHSEIPYRFGRPAPVTPAPVANGPNVRIGVHNFGRSVGIVVPAP